MNRLTAIQAGIVGVEVFESGKGDTRVGGDLDAFSAAPPDRKESRCRFECGIRAHSGG